MHALGRRETALERLGHTVKDPLDLLVVGGGITGAGIALDAASRGLRVGLVERFDFASGTSSKSSKLVHGGIRYLEQREFGLMREACIERDLLRRLAPQLVQPVPFVFPVSQRLTRAKVGVGMWAYDALASFHNLKVHKHLDGAEAEALVPALPRNKVRGGYVFYDCKTDDARLVVENLVQACRYGATVVNHAAVRDLVGGTDACRAVVEDTVEGTLFDVAARKVIVAGGVWADHIEQLANHRAQPRLRPSKGIHLVFKRESIPIVDAAAAIPDAERKRLMFVIPWLDHVLVGTTDDAYEGSLDTPSVEDADRRYCLDALNASLDVGVTEADIVGAYAGLRPLVAAKQGATADLSRRHTVYDIAPGITGITGGKLTTYRRMAAEAVDYVAPGAGRSRTRWIRLGASDVGALTSALERRMRAEGTDPASLPHLVRTYGERAFDVLDVCLERGLDPLVPGHRPLVGEAVYAAREEMAVHLDDLLWRRTRLALLDGEAGSGDGSLALETLADEHGWSEADRIRELSAHRAAVERERGRPVGPVAAVPAPVERAEVG